MTSYEGDAYAAVAGFGPAAYLTISEVEPPVVITVVATAFLFWDMLITLGDEAEQIWSVPWSHLKSLYVLIRVLAIIAQSMNIWIAIIKLPPHCLAVMNIQILSSSFLMFLSQLVTTLRVCALYRDTKLLYHGLRTLYVLEIICILTLFGISKPYLGFCGMGTPPLPAAEYAFAAPPLAYDSLIFALTLYKFFVSLRIEGWTRMIVIRKFMTDGIWAFALPTAVLILNIGLNTVGGEYIGSGSSWITTINAFSGYRLILSTLKMLQYPDTHNFSSSSQTHIHGEDTGFLQGVELTNLGCVDSGYGSSNLDIPRLG